MNYKIEIVPIKFASRGRTVNTINVFFEGKFIGSANQARAAASMLTDRKVPVADVCTAIDQAGAVDKHRGPINHLTRRAERGATTLTAISGTAQRAAFATNSKLDI